MLIELAQGFSSDKTPRRQAAERLVRVAGTLALAAALGREATRPVVVRAQSAMVVGRDLWLPPWWFSHFGYGGQPQLHADGQAAWWHDRLTGGRTHLQEEAAYIANYIINTYGGDPQRVASEGYCAPVGNAAASEPAPFRFTPVRVGILALKHSGDFPYYYTNSAQVAANLAAGAGIVVQYAPNWYGGLRRFNRATGQFEVNIFKPVSWAWVNGRTSISAYRPSFEERFRPDNENLDRVLRELDPEAANYMAFNSAEPF
ncbi:hypothetical protein HYS93_00400 [Candidatus Daviesbacteria bacterium]|nr:hypothetical protein [Candidatus Daviesbacteria bacterium]